MNHDAIIEVAARALGMESYVYLEPDEAARLATAVLVAVTPLIEEAALKRWVHELAYVKAAALEEAAKVADKIEYMPPSTGFVQGKVAARNIAAAIRALKEQP